MRTVVYVDGYNLYYGLLRKTTLKWLDLVALFRNHVLATEAELVQVRYYTAPVLGRMCDNPESPQRQRIYLQALRRLYPDLLVIVEGKIQATKSFQRLVKPIPEAPTLQRVLVHGFNEKKTDVNIARDCPPPSSESPFGVGCPCSRRRSPSGILRPCSACPLGQAT